jgi:HD-GYP domain-containing protein (c-di-GMP phosphodiesterase class II)
MTARFDAALRVKELEARIAGTQTSLICAFNQLLDLKDLSTGVHSTRLAEWGVRVARDLGLGEERLHDIEIAALLHDIGKIGIPDAILRHPGPLSDADWQLMRKHPEYGWAIVRLFADFDRASLFVLHHHERWDGAGYPAGLKGTEIPVGARIVAVIDAFDAMTANRPYRRGLKLDEAIKRLVDGRGAQFDAAVVDCFVRRASEERELVYEATGTGEAIAF